MLRLKRLERLALGCGRGVWLVYCEVKRVSGQKRSEPESEATHPPAND